ncbi:hypothetical protein [Burkholderia pseudomallei]|uniref:hypothetical protein n=1 Tax=Burkholderia pseudomallei TaxID=28450 RepID=UPI000F09A4C1|nr:hypothetical protein [Burkholderia pseudomallei]
MRAELANACPCDIRSAWDEDRLIGRAIARGFVFDDAIDRIGWAMGRVGDHAVMSVEIEAAALWKKGGFLWRGACGARTLVLSLRANYPTVAYLHEPDSKSPSISTLIKRPLPGSSIS